MSDQPQTSGPKAAASGEGAAAPAAPKARTRQPSERAGLDFVLDVPLRVTVEIGSARMLVSEVLQLDKGSVVELDRMAGEPADVLVNGRLVARGEVTLVDERLAVRLLELEGGERGGDTGQSGG